MSDDRPQPCQAPPWQKRRFRWRHAGPQSGPPWAAHWHRRRRFFLARAAGLIGLMAVLVAGGMAVLAYLLTRQFGGNGHTAFLVWLGGCGLALGLPLLAAGLALRAIRRLAVPTTNILATIDAVAAGDLSARVPEHGEGEIARLAQSFNRMVEELERTDQQRRNLTTDVAHELRTPLHIIQGNLEGVLDGVYTPTSEHIEATLEETRLLARLVEDLRTLSLAESGQLPLQQEPVCVRDLLADVVTSLSAQAEAAGITLSSREQVPGTLTITGDAGRLDQMLSNLVINAIRHTPPGGRITLDAARADGDVCITVADTGEGIAPEDLPFVFDRFWRANRARDHSGGAGSGLGLAITSQLAQSHGGTIQVESSVGSGTTFTIHLPAGHS